MIARSDLCKLARGGLPPLFALTRASVGSESGSEDDFLFLLAPATRKAGVFLAPAGPLEPRDTIDAGPHSKRKAPVRYAGLLERKASGVRGWGLAFRSPRQCTGPIYRSLQS
jgi:hypothetical protein